MLLDEKRSKPAATAVCVLVTVALANKMARIAFTIMRGKTKISDSSSETQ
jgi:hypothetical protein